MLNVLSFNLMNELNESETNSIIIKKKVIIESDKISTENINEGFIIQLRMNNYDGYWGPQEDAGDNNVVDKENAKIYPTREEAENARTYIKNNYNATHIHILKESEEPNHQILNEENSDAVDRLFSGNELYFRTSDGTALMIHYADNYPQPEEYDEGYKTEFGGSEEALNKAQQAADSGDVWELVEVDDEGNPTSTIYGYAYGIDELKSYLKDLREVKIKKSLEEDKSCNQNKDLTEDSSSDKENNNKDLNENNKPITEANVSKKVLLKNQGNVYMFECKGNKDFTHIVGENFNESENLLENVETYNNKEDADVDYNKRCGLNIK